MDQVISAFRKEKGRSLEIDKIPWVKFLSPLKPGDRIEFSFETSNSSVLFIGKCAEKTIVSGQLEFSVSS